MSEATEEVVEEVPGEEVVTEEVVAEEGETTEVVEAEEAEELEITIGDEKPEPQTEAAPDWVKEVRQRNRELATKNRELEAQIQAKNQPEAKAADPGPEPAMGDADIDYDADKFKDKWRSWNDKRRKIEDEERARKDAETQAQQAWQKTIDTYKGEAKALKVPDFDDAEEAAKEALSVVQQAIIVQAVEKRAQMMYALGKNPKRLQDLAAITDPVKFAVKIGEMAAMMKVTSRKPTTKPEAAVRSSAAGVAVGNAKMDGLLKKAEQTGDYTAYLKAQRESRAAKKQ
jgi:hypothetical protein